MSFERIRLVFAVALLTCAHLVAQSAPKQPTLWLPVNVLDRNGNAVRNLTRDNFHVKVNGHLATPLDAHYSLAPRRIVVLLDMSGSMAGVTVQSRKWELAREAVEDFLTETPSDVQVAVITFSSGVHDIFNFSQSRSSITAWLKRGAGQQPIDKGQTALYDAIDAAAKLLEPALPGDSIYAITDGGDNHSHISETAVRQRLLQSQIRFFLFMFADPPPFYQEQLGGTSVMELARDTGGFVFGISGHRSSFASPLGFDYSKDDQNKIKPQTQALNIQVNGFYTLQLDANLSTNKANKLSLEVVDGSGKVRKDVSWTYSREFPAQVK